MENTSTQFSPNIKNYIEMTAHWAMVMVVVVSMRLCFTIYYTYTYYSSLTTESTLDTYTYSYLGNSMMDVILSTLSAYFLYRFAQFAYQFCRNNDSLSIEGFFSHFRNYLIMFIILSLNWMFFSMMNLFGRIW